MEDFFFNQHISKTKSKYLFLNSFDEYTSDQPPEFYFDDYEFLIFYIHNFFNYFFKDSSLIKNEFRKKKKRIQNNHKIKCKIYYNLLFFNK